MLFIEWCAQDVEDERKINYEVLRNGKVEHFTSEDEVPFGTLYFLKSAELLFVKLFHNEWFVIVR